MLSCDRSFSLNPSPKGQFEQWGSVHRKKDKKHQNPIHDPKDRTSPRDRPESRGGRGRGGRGGGRGGLSRGGAPGRNGQNGHRAQAFNRSEPVDSTTSGTDNADPSTLASKDESAPSTLTWASDPTTAGYAQDLSSQTTGTGWGESTSSWDVDPKPNGAPSSAVQAKPLTPVPGQPKPAPKNPATSKLSWAQVARYAHFHVEIFSNFLIVTTAHKRNPHQHLLPPYNHNLPLLPPHPLLCLNNHRRSKKLHHHQNQNHSPQPLGRNLPPCKSPHGRRNLRRQ